MTDSASATASRADQIRNFVLASHGNLEAVQRMLTEDPTLLEAAHPWSDTDSETALAAAAHVGNRAIAEFLLAQGATITPGAAAMLGRKSELATMLTADPQLANAVCVHTFRLLFHAALSGDISVAELLVDHGCTMDFNDALHAAVAKNHVEMVRWLLTHGISDINTLNYQGKTPLTQAKERGLTEIAAALEQFKAPTA